MENILAYGFMQRALLTGVFIAVACAILGVFLILRRDAMIGHGMAHITFGGVALGLFLGREPLLIALAVSVLCSLLILRLREKAGIYEDTAVGIFSSAGMAMGVILATVSGKFNVDLFGYLFGNILAIESFEVGMAVGLALAIIAVVVLFYQEFLYQTFDTESARTSGIRGSRLDGVLALLTSVTVVIGMKVVGILLVAALLVIPSAAGLQLAHNFRQAMVISAVVAMCSVITGLAAAFYWDFPASGTIVITSFIMFLTLGGLRILRSARAA
jgi:zinc transport system permease protein